MLNVKNLVVSYGKKEILHGVNLQVRPHEIYGIVGESGSGKSTLLHSILGLMGREAIIHQGEILFQGKDLLKTGPREKRLICGNEIAMVFQHPSLSFDPVTTIGNQVYEAVRMHRKASKAEVFDKMESLLADMNFTNTKRILASYPFELSGGMNQRVALALAMINDPKLLLADEPTSALDVTVQAQVVELMMKLRDKYGMTILIVTHNIGVVSYMADQIAVMYQGNIVEQGDKFELLTKPEHDYSRKLISSVPVLNNIKQEAGGNGNE